MQKIQTVNRIEAHGRLVSIKSRKDNKKVLTLYSQNRNRDIYVKFICDENMNLDFKEHSRLCVKGYVRTYNTHVKSEYKEVQQFIATNIEEEKTWTEIIFGDKGKFFPPMDTLIFIKGNLSSFIEEEEWIRLKIKVTNEENNETYHIKISMRRADRMFKLSKGMPISIVCSLATPRKNLGGDTVHFENIMAMDVSAS